MSEIAELFYPAVRWDASRGHEGERAAIEQALKLGVGGFILFGGPSEQIAELTEHLHSKSHIPLLIGADLERGAGQQFAGQTALPPPWRSGTPRDSARPAAWPKRNPRRRLPTCGGAWGKWPSRSIPPT